MRLPVVHLEYYLLTAMFYITVSKMSSPYAVIRETDNVNKLTNHDIYSQLIQPASLFTYVIDEPSLFIYSKCHDRCLLNVTTDVYSDFKSVWQLK